MSQLSYLQQIAQRDGDRLAVLSPPRSPFPRFDSPVPMEILEESPQSASRVGQEKRLSMSPSLTTDQTESFAKPLIQLPNKTLEPSPTIGSLNRLEMPNSTQVAFETTSDSDVEMPEPRQIAPRLSLVAQDHSVIAPQALQSQTSELPARNSYAIETQNLLPQRTSGFTPSITEFSDPLVSQPTQAESLNENSLPIESPAILRWLIPTIQDRNVEMLDSESPLPKFPRSEIPSEAATAPIALVTQELIAQEHSPKGNTIHIGAIDIQIMPATVEPAAIAPSPVKSVSTTPLARSYSGSFGLRQG